MVLLKVLVVCVVAGCGQGRLILHSSHGSPFDDAKEVSELSDRIYAATGRVQSLRSELSEENRYYEKRKALLVRQIEIRKKQLEVNPYPVDADYQTSKESDFQDVMCSELMKAWILDDSSSRLHLARLCLGRDSLALLQLQRGPSTLLARSSGQNNHVSLNNQSLSESLRQLQSETRFLVAWEDRLQREGHLNRGPADDMRNTLQRIQQEEQSLEEQLIVKKATWKREIEALNDEERSLGQQYGDQHFERSAADKAAWAKVKAKFCPGGVLGDNAIAHCNTDQA